MQERQLEESELAIYKNRKEAFDRAPANIQTSLKKKATEHNKEVNQAKTKKTDKFILAVVFWRGVGAYKSNPESVRPNVQSPEQWGLGRVNGFLYGLKNGEFKNKPYDQDLLPKGHPHSSRSADDLEIRVSQLGMYQPLKDANEETIEIVKSPIPKSMDFPLRYFDYPDDDKTKAELRFLIDLSKYRHEFQEYIQFADRDYVEIFYKFLKENDLPITSEIKERVKSLVDDSSNLILKLKYHYNRPRPNQVAKRLGLDFVSMDTETAHTPSYPSGHTIQAMMMADLLGEYYESYKPYFYEIADMISLSRMYGGYHFPSDIRYGKMVFADYMKYKKETRALTGGIGGVFDDSVVAEKLEFDDLLIDLKDLIFVDNRDKEFTNFPKRGDDLKVSLRNSNWQIFPIDFAEDVKNNYPTIWAKGGNIKGNDQYRDLVPVQKRGGNVINKKEEDAVRLREAWVARHYEDFRIAGVIAQIKWLAVGSRGLEHMKNLVREEMKKVDDKKEKRTFCTDEFDVVTQDDEGLVLKSKTPLKLSMYVDHLFDVRNIKTEIKKDADGLIITGVASSTSVDHYGTEMSLNALRSMKSQIEKGVVILPRHESLSGGTGLAEWDEVIGRTVSSKIIRSDVEKSADASAGYVLEVTSELYNEDERSKNLMKRLNRGELIGQSIGGWFEHVRVIESSDGEVERIIVEDVVLDHIAITRAPANPDSYGLSLLNVRTKLNSFLGREIMENKEQEVRNLDDSAVVVSPEVGQKDQTSGDGNVDMEPQTPLEKVERATPLEEELEAELDDVKDHHSDLQEDYDRLEAQYEVLKEKYEQMLDGKKRDLMDEDEAEKVDHEEGALEDDQDHIEKLEVDEAEDKEDLQNLMKGYMEKMMKDELSKEEMQRMQEELERMMKEYANSEVEETRNLEISELNLDTRSKLDHDLNINESNNLIKGEDMNKEQMQEFAEIIARSVAGAVTPTEVVTKDTGDVEDLRSRLAQTESMLAQVMNNPVRRGRHVTATITGIGAVGAFSELITRSRAEGNVALSAVVEHNVEKLGTDKIAKLSSHELRSMLSAGLNAAQRDGLLGQALSSWE